MRKSRIEKLLEILEDYKEALETRKYRLIQIDDLVDEEHSREKIENLNGEYIDIDKEVRQIEKLMEDVQRELDKLVLEEKGGNING